MADDPRNEPAGAANARHVDADDLLDQLAQNTSESAGGNVSATGAETDLDIIFEPEMPPKAAA